MSDWQPIETARRSSDPLLLYNGEFVTCGYYDDYQRSWVDGCNSDEVDCAPMKPTHWMPLPDPPSLSSKGA